MPFDSKAQRQIMGRFATGVALVSTLDGDKPAAMTANGIASLSLDPPLILFTLAKNNYLHGCLKKHKVFAVNILAEHHKDLSNYFAKPGPKDFSTLDLKTAETGAPILADALAHLDCRVVDVHPGGDHDIFIGEIVAGQWREGRPLLFYDGDYAQLGEE